MALACIISLATLVLFFFFFYFYSSSRWRHGVCIVSIERVFPTVNFIQIKMAGAIGEDNGLSSSELLLLLLNIQRRLLSSLRFFFYYLSHLLLLLRVTPLNYPLSNCLVTFRRRRRRKRRAFKPGPDFFSLSTKIF